ncbi:MAG: 2-oxo acid dehydrogenase subunit E2 [Verrucomicrobiae bacterium]|nr:2-oxo acid dehydrogenase subunit E2 [Verrucomicrobiae bacterium]
MRNVTGTGPGGRISVEDIKSYVRQTAAQRATTISARAPVELPDFTKFGEVSREPMSGVRRATARHMSLCWSEIPHVTIFERADVTGLEEVRKEFKAKAEEAGGRLTITALLLKVVAAALKAHPRINASLDLAKQEIVFKRYYHIGVAVDTPRGLLVPVLRDADKKTIIQIAVELTRLSEKARTGKLAPDDMQGASFTVTNLGGLGTTYFTPIVNFPEVAILGVGRATMEPVFSHGTFEPRLLMPLSLSFDHRIVDGADGARFLHWIVEAMEKPLMLSMEG